MIALYKFRFYELDQAISVGAEEEFWFFVDPHFDAAPSSPISRDMILVFANTVGLRGTVSHRCKIRSITHPSLGKVTRIVTTGFDYTITLEDGRVFVVDAEERAGTLVEGDAVVDDWAFIVDLVQVNA